MHRLPCISANSRPFFGLRDGGTPSVRRKSLREAASPSGIETLRQARVGQGNNNGFFVGAAVMPGGGAGLRVEVDYRARQARGLSGARQVQSQRSFSGATFLAEQSK